MANMTTKGKLVHMDPALVSSFRRGEKSARVTSPADIRAFRGLCETKDDRAACDIVLDLLEKGEQSPYMPASRFDTRTFQTLDKAWCRANSHQMLDVMEVGMGIIRSWAVRQPWHTSKPTRQTVTETVTPQTVTPPATETVTGPKCLQCGKPLAPVPGKRAPLYCSGACKVKASRARRK